MERVFFPSIVLCFASVLFFFFRKLPDRGLYCYLRLLMRMTQYEYCQHCDKLVSLLHDRYEVYIKSNFS